MLEDLPAAFPKSRPSTAFPAVRPSPRAQDRRCTVRDRVSATAVRCPRWTRAAAILAANSHLIPGEAGQPRLHRLVGAMIKAPVEIEVVDLMPVALAERVGEAAIDGAARVQADQIESRRRRRPRWRRSPPRRQGSAGPARDGMRDRRIKRWGSSARSASVERKSPTPAPRRARSAAISPQRDSCRRRRPPRTRPTRDSDWLTLPGWRTLPRFIRTKSVDSAASHANRLAGVHQAVERARELLEIGFHRCRRGAGFAGDHHALLVDCGAAAMRVVAIIARLRTRRHRGTRTPATRAPRESPATARPCRSTAFPAPAWCRRCRPS